jgi:hypothetical protein
MSESQYLSRKCGRYGKISQPLMMDNGVKELANAKNVRQKKTSKGFIPASKMQVMRGVGVTKAETRANKIQNPIRRNKFKRSGRSG